MKVTVDTREPWPHPWSLRLAESSWQTWSMERGALETGDLALAALPNGIVIERKTPSDLASCLGNERDRFERELRRGRYCGRMLVIVEGTFGDVVKAARGVHYNAVVGTLASWSVRYCPFIFAGSVDVAGRRFEYLDRV